MALLVESPEVEITLPHPPAAGAETAPASNSETPPEDDAEVVSAPAADADADDAATAAKAKPDEKKVEPTELEARIARASANLARKERASREKLAHERTTLERDRASVHAEKQAIAGVKSQLESRFAKLERFEAAVKDHDALIDFIAEHDVPAEKLLERGLRKQSPESRAAASAEERVAKLEAKIQAAEDARVANEAESVKAATYSQFARTAGDADAYPLLNTLYTPKQILEQGVAAASELTQEAIKAEAEGDYARATALRSITFDQIAKYLDDEAEKKIRANDKLSARLGTSAAQAATQQNGNGTHASKPATRALTNGTVSAKAAVPPTPTFASEEEEDAHWVELLRQGTRKDREARG